MAYKPEAWRPHMTFQEFRREVWSPTDPSKTYVIFDSMRDKVWELISRADGLPSKR